MIHIERSNTQTKRNLAIWIASAIILIVASISAWNLYKTADAVGAAGFEAGNIIDDTVFTNYKSMSASQIQAFLKRTTSTCYPDGIKPIPQWVYDNGNTAPFICLGDYSVGGRTGAQIIYDTSQKYRINPQVLLVLLEKEQVLVSDAWPVYNSQYKSATGYGCPDTAACDSEYFGLVNQLEWAGKMFRSIMDGVPQSQWYTPYVLGNNFIQYNPNASCGGSTVNIKNRATQALYNYTPYQPNQAALNAGLGSASCGAYGNRNFYIYFTQWFGSTKSTPNYNWLVETQQAEVDGTSSGSSVTLAPGQSGRFIIRAKNTGNQTWLATSTRLATSRPNDRRSVLEDISWLKSDRPTKLKEQSVSPGEIGTFEFTVKAPNTQGVYKEYFNIVIEGQAWLNDLGLYYNVTVKNPSTPFYNAQILERRLYTNPARTNEISVSDAKVVRNGNKLYGKVKVKNTGNQTLDRTFTYLATTVHRDRKSVFQDESWISADRTSRLVEPSVTPGQTGTFLFTLSSPETLSTYTENFGVVAEGRAWADADRATFRITTTEPAYDTINADTSLPADKYLQSENKKYTFLVQSDGNLVLYNNGRAIWASNTAGRNATNLTLQSDGNLVIYNNGRAVWSNNKAGLGATNMILQGDGNLVIYSKNGPIWATNTAGR